MQKSCFLDDNIPAIPSSQKCTNQEVSYKLKFFHSLIVFQL